MMDHAIILRRSTVKLLLCAVLGGDSEAQLQQCGHGGGGVGGRSLHRGAAPK